MKEVIFVTGNSYKFAITNDFFKETDIHLIKKEMETPEIQSTSVEDIAKYSARWVADQLQVPVIVSDAGWYFISLKGFPGPFIKYMNYWFTPDDYLRIMNGVKERGVEIHTCYAYCEPNVDTRTFFSKTFGKLAYEKGNGRSGETSINQVFIPEGKENVASELPYEEMVDFWSTEIVCLRELADFLKTQL